MPAPRPILKSLPSPSVSSETASNPLPFSSCPTIFDSPHVHFPPTPTLTSTEITHSSFIYDRAPIVVTPNVCALPERGGRKFVGSNSNNQGGLGYFHPHAKFQVNAVRSERDSVELFMKKRSGPMYDYDYDYEYDQYSCHDQHAEHIVSSLLFDHSSDSSDSDAFYTPPCIQTPSSSSLSSSSIPHSSLSISPRNVYNTSSSSPSPTAGHYDTHQEKKKNSVDVGKKRGKKRNGAEEECRTKRTMLRSGALDSRTSPELGLEGCLGGF